MRLTLRTLLAYLDDTLEPGEIKQIGQKVAESDAAQELVARIKQVTRRRRLTTPTDGGANERFDANRVAAYLDNELSSEDIAEIEKLCLESDVHLAEIAATHQILTLVLGEPALVPPTAKRRMYALLQGRPQKTTTKPTPTTISVGADGAVAIGTDADDTLMALPLFRKFPWMRWALPLAAVLLLSVLGIILFNNLNSTPDNRVSGRQNQEEESPDKDRPKPDDKTKLTDKPSDAVKPPIKPDDKTKITDKDKKPDDGVKKDGTEVIKPVPPAPGKPSMERQPAGTYISKEQVLVHRDRDEWKRFGLSEQINTGEQLVSLPGYKSEVKLDNRVNVLLWGNLPEFMFEALMESSITLHPCATPGPDVDLTLHRGRIYLSNKKEKGSATVRVRFWREEVWDIILEDPDSVVGLELVSIYLPELRPQQGEEPLVQVAMYVMRGTASLKVDRRTFGDLRGPTGRALVVWNNKGKGVSGPHNIDARIPEWEIDQPLPREPRQQKLAEELRVALSELAGTLTRPEKLVSTALFEFMEEKALERRLLGVRSLAAIDGIQTLLDALAREDATRSDVRQEALFAIKNWLNRGVEMGKVLYDPKTQSGLLVDKMYTNRESQIILDLLYGFSTEERKQKETFEVLILYLKHKKLLIRDLAIRHLAFLAPQYKIEYNPAGPVEQRDRGYDEYKKLLDAGKLPPPPPGPAPMP